MQLKHLLVTGLATGLVSAAAVQHPQEMYCHLSRTPQSGATCASFAKTWELSVDTLKNLNPGITCPHLDISKSYCVMGLFAEETSTTTAPQPRADSTTSEETAKNEPKMPGIVDSCDGFYKVKSGDQCNTIAKANGISQKQLRRWNSKINDECTNLWLGYYVCVHAPSAIARSEDSQSIEEASAPKKQMPGIVKNCKNFHRVKDGDTCDSISKKAGISVGKFRKWNTKVNARCTNLWLGYDVCVGV